MQVPFKLETEEDEEKEEEELFDDDEEVQEVRQDLLSMGQQRAFETMELGRIIRDSEFDKESLAKKSGNPDLDGTAKAVTLTGDHQGMCLLIALNVDTSKGTSLDNFVGRAQDVFGIDLTAFYTVGGARNRGATFIHRVRVMLFE